MKHLLLTTIAAVVLVGCGPSMSIHDAAKDGNIEVVKQHLAAGADVELKCVNCGDTILGHAVSGGHIEIVELLVSKGADLNAKDMIGMTPLHYVASGGHKEIVELLIANGADVNAKDEYGLTPLHNAADKGRKEVADLLIAKGANVNAVGDLFGGTPLHAAAFGDHKEIVELLIAKGADVNAKVASGFNKGMTPLDLAIDFKKPEIGDLLRKHGGKTGAELNVLLDAAKNGDIEAVKQHLADGADVNAKTADGTTPLHNAAVYGRNEIAELLIANGANMNAIIVSGRNQGKTPLNLAIWRKKNEAADLLRQHGGRTGEELALMPRLMQHGRFAFSFDAKEGKVYEVQDSFDLLNWEVIKTYTGTGTAVRFDEERDHDPPKIFYRVKVVE